MAKQTKETEPGAPEQNIGAPEFEITAASIKDDLCNYSFDIVKGLGAGDTHKVSGKGIVDSDLLTAMAKFNVHLAAIDDCFKHSGIDIDDIDMMHGHELATNIIVTGFRIKGGSENESIILTGTKHVSTSGDRMQISSPAILLDELSSYPWAKQLKKAADKARMEVRLYKEGKYTPIKEPEAQEDANQLKLSITTTDEEGNKKTVDFSKAKIK